MQTKHHQQVAAASDSATCGPDWSMVGSKPHPREKESPNFNGKLGKYKLVLHPKQIANICETEQLESRKALFGTKTFI